MKNCMILFIVLSISQVSLAEEVGSSMKLAKALNAWPLSQDLPMPLPIDDSTHAAPPTQDVPIPVGAFNFRDGKDLFDKGLLPTEQALIGTWNILAYADVSKDFAGMTDRYDEKGLANTDGTNWNIIFSWQTKEITGEQIFLAKFLNWGVKDANQGPYQARIDLERKAAIAALYASGSVTNKTYFVFDCRQVHNNSDLVICGVTLKLEPGQGSPAQKVYDGTMGGMIVLKRAN